MLKNKENIIVIIILILHLVGIGGLMSDNFHDLFIKLVPYNLLVTTGLLLFTHKHWNKQFIAFIGLCFGIGFAVEAVGVNTGLIFGDYYYGDVLGIKLFKTPLMIGVNWLLLVYAVGSITSKYGSNWILKSILGAALLVILDVLIEPIAIELNFWQWLSLGVPIKNYVGWFVTGFVLLAIFHLLKFDKQNKVGMAVYLIQLIFFIALRQ